MSENLFSSMLDFLKLGCFEKNFDSLTLFTKQLHQIIVTNYLPNVKHDFCKKKEVPPGLEPGLRGSKPRVLTNYTMEPKLIKSEKTSIKNNICNIQ